MNYFLGIDIGTTHTKAVIITGKGKPVFEAKQGYDLLRPQPGFEEQDADAILEVVIDVMAQAFRAAGNHGSITAVGFSAAMHSILPVDNTGTPLYHALTWADTRSKNEANEISRRADAGVLYKNTGIPAHPMSPLCKIAWFRNNKPGLFENTAKFISIKEYIFYKFFGKYIVDYSIASATGLFNINEKKWDALALQTAGIDKSKLSEPVSTTHAEYELQPVYETVFKTGGQIVFIAGASDGCLANLGSGAVLHGETALTIGTSGAVRMTVHQLPGEDDRERLFTYPLTDSIYVRGGAINNGGIILTWLSGLFSDSENVKRDYEMILSMAAQSEPGARGLLFLPYLLGERAPVWDADAKGALVGLAIKHQKEHIIRAAIEGICFTLNQLIKKLERAHGPVRDIYVSGGFVQSEFWVQLIADITGKQLKVTETADASAIGAASIAMYATGFLKSLEEVKAFAQVSKIIEPVLSNHKKYAELSVLFDSLYSKLKDDFAILSRL